MRLAAIYIEEHEYLFAGPQVINFGGEYIYEFNKQGDDISVVREKNDQFIEGLFDLNGLGSEVTHLNAIVGQNGSGKSTVLDIIRSAFIEHRYALPESNKLFLVEIDADSPPKILKNDFGKVYLQQKKTEKTEFLSNLKKDVQTIYYSPHFDYKFNRNFDEVDDHDISFDTILEKDLSKLNEKDSDQHGVPYSPNKELFFKNSLRQLSFLSSNLVSKEKIFKDIFHLPEHQNPLLEFRGFKRREEYRNTPYPFRGVLALIREKTEKELDDWTSVRKTHEGKVLNQIEVDKYLLKRNLINIATSLIQKVMERENSFLHGGVFPDDILEKVKEVNAQEALFLFLDNCSLKLNSGKPKKVFKNEKLKELFLRLYEIIEEIDDPENISQNTLKINMDNALEVLSLQRLVIDNLNSYYYTFYPDKDEPVLSEFDKVDEFINYMPFEKRLSSGEHALLNLFSRLYDFLDTNLVKTKFRDLKDHYILLLDEADLSFHPTWKKRFIKSILSTLPFFFDELENYPSLQIIFTTHDPLSLSDLPNPNVIYIERKSYNDQPEILSDDNEDRPDKTFGANISELISDSFFINDSLVGEFVTDLIKETIGWLEEDDKTKNADYYKKLIYLIDEPIVKRKLAEMYDNKMNENTQLDFVEEEIKKLEALKKRLKN